MSATSPGSGTKGAAKETGAFSPAVALWLIGAAMVSAAVFVILLAFGPQLRNGAGGANALSRSAVGYAGLVKLLRAEGTAVRLNGKSPLDQAAPSGLLLLMPELGYEQKALPTTPLGHVAVIITPKWATAPDLKHRGWVAKVSAYSPVALASSILRPLTGASWSRTTPAPQAAPHQKPHTIDTPFLVQGQGRSHPVLHAAGGFFTSGTQIRLADIDQFQAFSTLPSGWEQGLVDERGRTVVAFDRQRRLFVLSDPDILNTQGLATADGAMAASALIAELRSGDDPVVFDLTLSGLGGRSDKYDPLKLMLTPPFLSATLCGVAAALLMGLHAAIRFGPQRREGRSFALGKRALADNSAALIHMTKREASMGPGYVALTRDLALEGVNLGRTHDAAAVRAQLDRIAGARRVDTKFEDLARDAGCARDGPSLLAAAQALYHWRLEITRGR